MSRKAALRLVLVVLVLLGLGVVVKKLDVGYHASQAESDAYNSDPPEEPAP